MKKQRWRFTKINPHESINCSGCGKKLNRKEKYHRQYGFCDVNCGYTTYGLSWEDFI